MSRSNRDVDPDIWGPGTWNAIHTLGAFCNDTLAASDDSFVTFNQFRASVTCMLRNLPCSDCRGHAARYLTQNPITSDLLHFEHPQFGRIGPFVWTWKFHSAVNARKHKKNVDLATAWRMYRQEKCADGRCREASSERRQSSSHRSDSHRSGSHHSGQHRSNYHPPAAHATPSPPYNLEIRYETRTPRNRRRY